MLCPTSSGDHFLNLALEGATDITCFDINRLSKYYQELKITLIKRLDYSDFENILFSNDVYTCLITYFSNNDVQFKKNLKESVYEFCFGYQYFSSADGRTDQWTGYSGKEPVP